VTCVEFSGESFSSECNRKGRNISYGTRECIFSSDAIKGRAFNTYEFENVCKKIGKWKCLKNDFSSAGGDKYIGWSNSKTVSQRLGGFTYNLKTKAYVTPKEAFTMPKAWSCARKNEFGREEWEKTTGWYEEECKKTNCDKN